MELPLHALAFKSIRIIRDGEDIDTSIVLEQNNEITSTNGS